MNLFYAIVLGTIAQAMTFMQLQCNAKWGWLQKYPIPMTLVSIPIGLLTMYSVSFAVRHFNGTIWESRFLGFSIGIIVFAIMAYLLFGEPVTLKTIISIVLSVLIILTQFYVK
jgi:multidrug transporter EmrE-like cation transporter